MTKYLFVTGGVVSGIGKGISAAAIGQLLKNMGIKLPCKKVRSVYQCGPRNHESFSTWRSVCHT